MLDVHLCLGIVFLQSQSNPEQCHLSRAYSQEIPQLHGPWFHTIRHTYVCMYAGDRTVNESNVLTQPYETWKGSLLACLPNRTFRGYLKIWWLTIMVDYLTFRTLKKFSMTCSGRWLLLRCFLKRSIISVTYLSTSLNNIFLGRSIKTLPTALNTFTCFLVSFLFLYT